MAQLEHLRLVRLPERFERRKPPGFAKPTARDPSQHSGRLSTELTEGLIRSSSLLKSSKVKFLTRTMVHRSLRCVFASMASALASCLQSKT